jgi:hypothetical protein
MKKILICILCFLVATVSYAADEKLTALDAISLPVVSTDLLYIVDIGTTVSKKVTIDDLIEPGSFSDETGTGALVFGTAPTFTTSIATPLVGLSDSDLMFGLLLISLLCQAMTTTLLPMTPTPMVFI